MSVFLRTISSFRWFTTSVLICAGLTGCGGGGGGGDTVAKPAETPTVTIDDVIMVNSSELITKTGLSLNTSTISNGRQPAVRNGEVEVFVRLREPSIAEFCSNELAAGRTAPDGERQKQHASRIRAEHSIVGPQLAALGARELSRLQAGDNGFRIRVDASQLQGIRSIDGVTAVAPVAVHTQDLMKSVSWIGADQVQAMGVDGAGVTIAIIDSGIDYNHANFGGSGDPADHDANDPNIIEDGSFPTAKVTGGYDFAGANYHAGDPENDVPMPDPDPLDRSGHGSHVGGIASGLGVPGEIGVGVAPGAALVALKVFGDGGGSTTLVADAIEWALDPNGDGDTSDHVDVINMSLGSGFGSPDSPSAVAADNAVHMNIIVVASAGNSGPIPYVTGSPGVGEAVISVASSLTGGDTAGFTASGAVEGSFEATEGTGAVQLADGAVTGGLMQPSDPANVFGCTAIEDDMSGYVALISRGDCSFDEKYISAQNAGAIAILVYNDGADATRIAPIIMGGIGDLGVPITIPGVMTTSTAGNLLAGSIAGGGAVTAMMDIAIMVPTLFGDTISGFSSRGPGHGGSSFKPDITAPGDAILSTDMGTGTGGVVFGGTSMAAPHAAGLAALLRQGRPNMMAAKFKALMQNSSSAAYGAGAVGTAPLTRQGVGAVDAYMATKLTSIAKPGGVSFGRINPSKYKRKSVPFRVHTLKSGDRHYTVTHEPNQTFPGVEVTCPAYVDAYNGAKNKANIVLTMDPTVGIYDDAFHSQTEVDGWCVLEDGRDTLRVGYMAVIDPASNMKATGNGRVVEVRNKSGNVGWAEGFTLTSVGGGAGGMPHSINALGVRTGSFAAEGDLVEFGISTDMTWESLAAYEIDIYIDVDKDGVEDYVLVAADFFGDGFPVTAIFPQGALLFDTGADLNDASAVLTFIGPMDSPFGALGFLPAGDTDFDYLAVMIDLRSGEYDIQTGSVDLSREIVPDFNSFGLYAETGVPVPVRGKGDMLWLFQNDEAKKRSGKNQADIVSVSP